MRKYQSRNFKKQYDLGRYSPLYRNSLFSVLKSIPQGTRKTDSFSLDFGPVKFHVARHFGFCKGVENAIEVAYETLSRYPDRRVFMISELIHNPFVNADLRARGLRFIKTAQGKMLIPWEEISARDVVITPAFGATLEDKAELQARGVKLQSWDATCRFVENVWFRARELGDLGYTIIVHGKVHHEETRATVSHSRAHAPTIVIKDLAEAQKLGAVIRGEMSPAQFLEEFAGKYSEGFDPEQDLQRVAVVNQTTMLATETAQIAAYFRQTMIGHFGMDIGQDRVANTRDTLCYATKNNQQATLSLLDHPADLAVVIGGRNSSNTSHLVELCEARLPTYFIASEKDVLNREQILHYDFRQQQEQLISHFLPTSRPVKILMTSGASCPDAIVERVLFRLLGFFEPTRSVEEVLADNVPSISALG